MVHVWLGINLQCVDASASFLKLLDGVTDPEQKRKIIGGEFIEVVESDRSLPMHILLVRWKSQLHLFLPPSSPLPPPFGCVCVCVYVFHCTDLPA